MLFITSEIDQTKLCSECSVIQTMVEGGDITLHGDVWVETGDIGDVWVVKGGDCDIA